jgi:hypothetical protein
LPTNSQPQFVAGVVVRDCDVTPITSGSKIALFDTIGPDAGANSGQMVYLANSTMNGEWGNGTSGFTSNPMIGSYFPTCASKLLIIASYDPSGTQDGYFMMNNVPNTDAATGPQTSDLAVNGYYSGGTWQGEGHGDNYCCMFWIPGSFGTEDLVSLQAALGR